MMNTNLEKPMKPKLIATLAAGVLAGISLMSLIPQATAQNKTVAAPGTPPIGRLCEVTVLASVFSNKTETLQVNGTLLAMTDKWVVLQDGTFENWVPMERVVVLRASR